MASVYSALFCVKSRYSRIVTDEMIEQVARECGHRWRARKLGPVMTVQLMLLQLLSHAGLTGVALISGVKFSAQALCKAYQRLPWIVWMKLGEQVAVGCHAHSERHAHNGRCRGSGTTPNSFQSDYCGHRMLVVDGTMLSAPDSKALAAKYTKASNQRKTKPGFPMPRLLALMDLVSGLIIKVIDLPAGRGEQSVLTRIIQHLSPGDLLLGDRGLLSFAHLAIFKQAGVHGLFRLPKSWVVHGHGRKNRTRFKQLGSGDMLVKWSKPQGDKLKWLSHHRWKELPGCIVLRQVAVQIKQNGFRTRWMWIVTTLLDPHRYSAKSLAELYQKRWQIEIAFRHMKRTLNMNKLTAQSVDGVRKQILTFVMIYNLICDLMQQAAAFQHVPRDRISFTAAGLLLLFVMPDEPIPILPVHPNRQRPSEPRAKKQGGYHFPVLKHNRQTLQKPHAYVTTLT
jgi:hypothetical protein